MLFTWLLQLLPLHTHAMGLVWHRGSVGSTHAEGPTHVPLPLHSPPVMQPPAVQLRVLDRDDHCWVLVLGKQA